MYVCICMYIYMYIYACVGRVYKSTANMPHTHTHTHTHTESGGLQDDLWTYTYGAAGWVDHTNSKLNIPGFGMGCAVSDYEWWGSGSGAWLYGRECKILVFFPAYVGVYTRKACIRPSFSYEGVHNI